MIFNSNLMTELRLLLGWPIIWAWAHNMGPGPYYGKRFIWARAHMGKGPYGPRAHKGPGPGSAAVTAAATAEQSQPTPPPSQRGQGLNIP